MSEPREDWAGPREEPSWAAAERAAAERAAAERARYAQGPPISQPSAEPWWEVPPAEPAPPPAVAGHSPAPHDTAAPPQQTPAPHETAAPHDASAPHAAASPPGAGRPTGTAVPQPDAVRADEVRAAEVNGRSPLSARPDRPAADTPARPDVTATPQTPAPGSAPADPDPAHPIPAPRAAGQDARAARVTPPAPPADAGAVPPAVPASAAPDTDRAPAAGAATAAGDTPSAGQGPSNAVTGGAGTATAVRTAPAPATAPAKTAPAAGDTTATPGTPSRRFVDTAAITFIVTELLIRAWAAWGGYFSLDDFTFARLAAEKGLGSDLLLTPYNSHFMPGAYLLVWAETTIAPLDYRLVAGVDLALMAVSYVLTWLLIRRLAGPRLVALIPFAVAIFSPITLPATLWWAVSINQLAMLIAIPGALLAQLNYLRTGKARYAAIAVATAALALPFYEKAALVVPLVFVFTIILQPQADLPDRFKAALLRYKWQWASFVALGAVYAGVYLTRPLGVVRESAQTGNEPPVDLGGLLGNSATNSVPSGLLGGPWSWKAIGAVDATAHPPIVLRILAVAIIVAVIAVTFYRRPLVWQAWALLGGTLLFDVLVLAVGRLQLGSGAAMEYRYFTDLAPIGAIALTLALVGPPSWAASWPQRTGIEWPPVLGGTRLALANPNAVVLPLVVALFLSSLVSTVKYSNRWHDNPAKDYVANAQESILAMGRPVDLYDGIVPEKVAWGVLNPTNFPSRLMAPLDLPINPDPDVTDDLYVLDPNGRLSHARVTSAKAPTGTVKNCGYRIAGKRVPIFLDKELFNWWWYAELHYTAKQTTEVVFNSANTRGKRVTFEKGEHVLWVKVTGPAGWITLDNAPKSAGLCISYAAVGLASPAEPATP